MGNRWKKLKQFLGIKARATPSENPSLDRDVSGNPNLGSLLSMSAPQGLLSAEPRESFHSGPIQPSPAPSFHSGPIPSSSSSRAIKPRSTKSVCAICLEAMKAGSGQALFTAECAHAFHFACIASNARHGRLECPVCRARWKEVPWQRKGGEGGGAKKARPEGSWRWGAISRSFTSRGRPWGENLGNLENPRDLGNLEEMGRSLGARREQQQRNCYHGAYSSEPSRYDDDEPLAPLASAGAEAVEAGHSAILSLSLSLSAEVPAVAAREARDGFLVLAHLRAAARPGPAARAPIDLVAVLDTSGSMAGSKLALLKRAVGFVVSHLGPADRLALVAFSSSARRVLPLRRMLDEGRQQAFRAVDSLASAGGTNIADGLRKGARVLEHRRETNPVAAILLLSDGQDTYTAMNSHRPIPPPSPSPSSSPSSPPASSRAVAVAVAPRAVAVAVAPQAVAVAGGGGGRRGGGIGGTGGGIGGPGTSGPLDWRRLVPGSIRHAPRLGLPQIPVHTFGFGSDHDAATMHSISDLSGGTFSFVQRESALQDAFARCIGGLLTVVAQDVQLTVSCSSSSAPASAFASSASASFASASTSASSASASASASSASSSSPPGVMSINRIHAGSYNCTVLDNGRNAVIKLGDLYAEEERHVLLDVSLPATPAGSIVEAGCMYKDPITQEVRQSLADDLAIPRPKEVGELALNLEVDRQRNRFVVAEAIAKATSMADEGHIGAAQHHLQRAREALESSASAISGDRLCSALAAELGDIQGRMANRQMYESSGRAYMLSVQSSHMRQRATTRGDGPAHEYQTSSMADLVYQSQTLSSASSPFAAALPRAAAAAAQRPPPLINKPRSPSSRV